MFNPYKKPMTAREMAEGALVAWKDWKPHQREWATRSAIENAIYAAQNEAYRKAAEIVVDCGHVSSDLARQKILDCCWGNPFPFDTSE